MGGQPSFGLQLLAGLGRATGAALKAEWRRTPLHHMQLSTISPNEIAPPRIRKPRDAQAGQAIFAGKITLRGETLPVPDGGTPWDRACPSRGFAEVLHSFSWLKDLIVVGDDGAKLAQDWVEAWITEFGTWNTFAFAPHLIATRLMNWLDTADVTLTTPTARLSFARQTRHLTHSISDLKGPQALRAHVVLPIAIAVVQGPGKRLSKALHRLDRQLKATVLPDGFTLDRNPTTMLEVLQALLVLQEQLAILGLELSEAQARALASIAPALRFFQQGDGGLFGFQGGNAQSPALVRTVLQAAKVQDTPVFSVAPHAGYHRAMAAGGILMLDSGQVPPPVYTTQAHASALAFEYSYKARRIFVNCGHGRDGEWEDVSRLTPAHSTLTPDDQSQGQLVRVGWMRRVLGARLVGGPPHPLIRREEDGQETWLEGTHDAFSKRLGFTHARRIYMAATGDDLRGEDTILWDRSSGSVPVIIRFHLHPSVTATMARDGRSVLLVDAEEAGWRFRADARDVAIEPSIYFGADGKPQKTEQIVLRNQARASAPPGDPDNCVRWALQLGTGMA